MAGFKECVKCGHWHSPDVPCLSTSPVGSPQPQPKTKREASELGRLRQRVAELEAELEGLRSRADSARVVTSRDREKHNAYQRAYRQRKKGT